jgi:hypothetical protein
MSKKSPAPVVHEAVPIRTAPRAIARPIALGAQRQSPKGRQALFIENCQERPIVVLNTAIRYRGAGSFPVGWRGTRLFRKAACGSAFRFCLLVPVQAADPRVHCGPRISRRGEALQSRLCSSVANLDARSIPNAPIPIPHGGASGPVACRRYVHGSGRYVDGSWLIVAGTARYRRSKQCTNCQAANNPGGDVTAPCSRNPGCTRQTKTACD